jgi:hypothetical protein
MRSLCRRSPWAVMTPEAREALRRYLALPSTKPLKSHATKRERRYRYYVSQAILQGREEDAGSVARVPAMELERRVVDAVRSAASTDPREPSIETQIIRRVSDRPGATINSVSVGSSPCVLDPGADIRAAVEHITIRCTTLEIQLAEGMAEDSSHRILVIPWARDSPLRPAARGGQTRPNSRRSPHSTMLTIYTVAESRSLGTTAADQDFLVVDAVSRNACPKANSLRAGKRAGNSRLWTIWHKLDPRTGRVFRQLRSKFPKNLSSEIICRSRDWCSLTR